DNDEKCKTLVFLSGLTCTHENFIQKSGALKKAAELKLVLVCPDTSPRGLGIPGEDDSYDFGSGAGFYVDATEENWSKYQMYSYIVSDLLGVASGVCGNIDTDRVGVFGHSMGGHGALTIGLKNPGLFKSVSAFSPIVNPIACPWGVNAFKGYLGEENQEAWKAYDAVELAKTYSGPPLQILVDCGTEDNFLKQGQLLVERFKSTGNIAVETRMQPGYDHSYWFIQTFIDDHLMWHSNKL
ncbi:MAG: hypothetical protein SGCHY_004543, partial [Lobulomycetales sp.]